MNALRNLGQTVNLIGNSMTRLSTGLRINTAADDPAGLIISEGMRAQIRGVDQAIRNSQDAVNMTKTAEGALDEIQKLMREMRGLAVQSANSGVVDGSQLAANQQQIRSSLQSITRIASQTQWGTKKLLDGTSGNSVQVTSPTNVSSIALGSTVAGNRIISGDIDIVSRTTAATNATVTGSVTFGSPNAIVPAGTIVLNGFSIQSTGSDTVSSFVTKMNQLSQQTGVVASAVPSGANTVVRFTQLNSGANYSVNLTDASGILNGAASTTATGVDGQYVIRIPTTDAAGFNDVTFTGGRAAGDSGLRLTDTEGNTIVLTGAANAATVFPINNIGAILQGGVQFQIGGYSNQSVVFSMPKVFPTDLGISAVSGKSLADLDVTTVAGANDAMLIIDDAITQLAKSRGDVGSFQANFLESTVRSLGVAKENLSAAESQIRDADIAEEMTVYTQRQILQQSGMAILAQANQAPNQVLQLLRGQ
jgi:flagellin